MTAAEVIARCRDGEVLMLTLSADAPPCWHLEPSAMAVPAEVAAQATASLRPLGGAFAFGPPQIWGGA